MTFGMLQRFRDDVAERGPTPYLLMDLGRIRANVDTVRVAFSALRPQVYYSVKANAHPQVLAAIRQQGCGFDIASAAELQRLVALAVPASQIVFSSTVKVPAHIAAAHAYGIDRFACDSQAEITKLARYAPGAKVIVRLEVPHTGSRWPLAGKFGVLPGEALKLFQLAQASGLTPYGVTFHVGSQCLRTESWLEALAIAGQVWHAAAKAGMPLRLVDLGGGLPSRYLEDVPSVAEIGNEIIRRALPTFGPEAEYVLEPGRVLVADAGTMVATVIGKALRKGKPWVFIDLSIYAGLLEVIGGWTYPVVTEKDDLPKRMTTLAGPTCDSTDIIARSVALPDLEVGDRVFLMVTGAYTTAYEGYNGFSFPTLHAIGAKSSASDTRSETLAAGTTYIRTQSIASAKNGLRTRPMFGDTRPLV